MSVPMGQIAGLPPIDRRSGGNVLADLNMMLQQQRARAVQDDTLQRDALTRGIINLEAGNDANADWKQILDSQSSQAGTGLTNANTGSLRGVESRAASTFDQEQQMKSMQDAFNLQFGQGIAEGQYDPQNTFLQQMSKNPEFTQMVGEQARPGFDKREERQGNAEYGDQRFAIETGMLSDRALGVGAANNQVSTDKLTLEQPIRTQAAQDIANTQGGIASDLSKQGADQTNQLDINRGERSREATQRLTDSVNSMLGDQFTPEQVKDMNPSTFTDMINMQNQQLTDGIGRYVEFQKQLLDENGKLNPKFTKVNAEYQEKIDELRGALARPKQTDAVKKLLQSNVDMMHSENMKIINDAKDDRWFKNPEPNNVGVNSRNMPNPFDR